MNPDPTSLDRLHDIIAPPPVAWWPPAPGWYWLGGVLLFALVVSGIKFIAHWQANCYRREALRELKRYVVALPQSEQRADAIAGMATILKRTALTAFPRERVASLTGSAWLAFLDQTGQTAAFSKGTGSCLEKAAYDPRYAASITPEDMQQLAAMVRHWIAHHRTEIAQEEPA